MPKRDSQSVSTLEAMADRMRQLLPTMYTTAHRAPVRTTVGLTAIGRKITAAIPGWRDIGRDGRITTTLVAAIGTATVIVDTVIGDMDSDITGAIGTETTIVDIGSETGSLVQSAAAGWQSIVNRPSLEFLN